MFISLGANICIACLSFEKLNIYMPCLKLFYLINRKQYICVDSILKPVASIFTVYAVLKNVDTVVMVICVIISMEHVQPDAVLGIRGICVNHVTGHMSKNKLHIHMHIHNIWSIKWLKNESFRLMLIFNWITNHLLSSLWNYIITAS